LFSYENPVTVSCILVCHQLVSTSSPNEAWETLAKLFSKKNEARLQLLEKELASISQGTMSINKYFIKVKNICREIRSAKLR
jgi:hypothetical protein